MTKTNKPQAKPANPANEGSSESSDFAFLARISRVLPPMDALRLGMIAAELTQQRATLGRAGFVLERLLSPHANSSDDEINEIAEQAQSVLREIVAFPGARFSAAEAIVGMVS